MNFETITDFFKSLLGFSSEGKFDIMELLNKAMEIAKIYGAVSGDPRVPAAMAVTSVVLDGAEKLNNPDIPAEEKLVIVDKLVKTIKEFD